MKRILLLLILVIFATSAWAAEMMSVQVKSAPVKSRPSMTGSVITTLVYTDRVEVLDESRGWMQVRTSNGITGWLHGSTLSDKEIVYSSGAAVSSGASSNEMALAGKGFNAEIEQEFKDETNLDFSWVDIMASWEVPVDDLLNFLEVGDLEGAVE